MGTIDDVKGGVSDVLLYVSEIWVEMGAILMALEGFHHRVAIWIVENIDQHDGDGGWDYHHWKKPWSCQGYGPSKNTFRGGRPPLRHTFPTRPYMNYAWGQKRYRYPAY